MIDWKVRYTGWVGIDVRGQSGRLPSSCRCLDSHQVNMGGRWRPNASPEVDKAA